MVKRCSVISKNNQYRKNKFSELVFEDEHLLIINKSSGVAVIPERNNEQKSILEWFQPYYDFIKPAHRIDKETSGLLVLTKSLDSYKAINRMFQEREVEKEYLAITKGQPYKEEFVIDLPIKHSNNSIHMKVDRSGKESVSHVKTLENTKNFGLLNVKILTGRTHQIRVHLSHKGFPILGDHLYNKSPEIFLSEMKRKYSSSKNSEERPMMTRTALHAYKLSFKHPITLSNLSFELPLPKDMRVCWKQLVKFDI